MSAFSSKLIDADRHVIEPNALWAQYLAAEFHAYLPYFEQNRTADGRELLPFYMLDGKPLLFNWNENQALQEAIARKPGAGQKLALATMAQSQLQAMDDTDVDIAVLFPTYAFYMVANENLPAKAMEAFAKAYNRWLQDYCSYQPKRLQVAGIIARHDPASMLQQLQQVIENAWKCIVMRPEKLGGRVVGHPDYEEFWAACEAHGIAIAFHGSTHVHAPTAGADRFDTHFAMHACAHLVEAQMAFLSLLEKGVFERYPRLKFAFLEAGASWLPAWLWTLDEVCYAPLPEELAGRVTMKPSAYFKRQCWVGIEAEEPCLRQVIDCVGVDRLLLGSDFPHPDHAHFSMDDLLRNPADFSQHEVERIVYHNPKAFFGIVD